MAAPSPPTRLRRIAVKSTGGRIRPRQSQPEVSGQSTRSIRNISTRSSTNAQRSNSPQPGPSGVRPKKTPQQNPPVESSSSSELIPSYETQVQPNAQSPSPYASPNLPSPFSSPNRSRNASRHSGAQSQAGSPIAAPTAPIPRNRPIRDQVARPTSPQRVDESDSAFRARVAASHRTYQRGGAG